MTRTRKKSNYAGLLDFLKRSTTFHANKTRDFFNVASSYTIILRNFRVISKAEKNGYYRVNHDVLRSENLTEDRLRKLITEYTKKKINERNERIKKQEDKKEKLSINQSTERAKDEVRKKKEERAASDLFASNGNGNNLAAVSEIHESVHDPNLKTYAIYSENDMIRILKSKGYEIYKLKVTREKL